MPRADLQPLGVLIQHRVDDVDEGFVAREEAVPAREEIALEPALALMLRQHLHDAAVGAEVSVGVFECGEPGLAGHLVHRIEPVGRRFVRAEQPEIALCRVQAHDLAQQAAEHARRFGFDRARRWHADRVIAKARHRQGLQQRAAVRMRIGAHAALPCRRERGVLVAKAALVIEQFAWAIALQPGFELLHVTGRAEFRDRHLVRAPRAFDRLAVDELRAGPAFRCAEHDHRPARACHVAAVAARSGLDRLDAREHGVERGGEALMHPVGIVALDEEGLVAVPAHQGRQLFAADAREHRRIRNLVAIQVQDRQHRAVARGIQELVRMPARRECTGFRLAVADHAADDQIRIVERRTVGMRERVPELAALVDRARRFGRHVARNAVRPRELPEQPLHAVPIALDRRIVLGVRAFEIRVRDDARPAVAGADHVNHVQPVRRDQAVQVHVEEVQARRRAPVTEQTALDVIDRQRHVEQRIVLQVDLADRQVVRGAPVGVHLLQQIGRERIGHRGFLRHRCAGRHRGHRFQGRQARSSGSGGGLPRHNLRPARSRFCAPPNRRHREWQCAQRPHADRRRQ
jgi:hypothetical protein